MRSRRSRRRGRAATIPALLAGRDAAFALDATLALEDAVDSQRQGSGRATTFRLEQKLDQFDEALLAASGIRLEALADDGAVTPGQSVTVSVFATVERT